MSWYISPSGIQFWVQDEFFLIFFCPILISIGLGLIISIILSINSIIKRDLKKLKESSYPLIAGLVIALLWITFMALVLPDNVTAGMLDSAYHSITNQPPYITYMK